MAAPDTRDHHQVPRRAAGKQQQQQPDDDSLAAFDVITKALAETPGHEGRHAAVGMLFDIKTVEARAAFPGEDGVLGYVQFDFAGQQADRMGWPSTP